MKINLFVSKDKKISPIKKQISRGKKNFNNSIKRLMEQSDIILSLFSQQEIEDIDKNIDIYHFSISTNLFYITLIRPEDFIFSKIKYYRDKIDSNPKVYKSIIKKIYPNFIFTIKGLDTRVMDNKKNIDYFYGNNESISVLNALDMIKKEETLSYIGRNAYILLSDKGLEFLKKEINEIKKNLNKEN